MRADSGGKKAWLLLVVVILLWGIHWRMVPDRSQLPLILSVGAFPFGLHFLLVTCGFSYTEPEKSAILAYSTPLWAVPLAHVFLRETRKGIRHPFATAFCYPVAVRINKALTSVSTHLHPVRDIGNCQECRL